MTNHLLLEQLDALIAEETNPIANMANTAALLYHSLPALNWAGFYLYVENTDELVLGPFQGNVACVRIKAGQGICGSALAAAKTIRVADVTAFPGHIACDAASRAEIVIPLKKGTRIIGVLDIDSPQKERFSQADTVLLEKIARLLTRRSNWSEGLYISA